MTTPADIDAIRERADEVSRAVYVEEAADASYPETVIGVPRLNKTKLMGTVDSQLRDLETLLDANAVLAERVRTLDAALRMLANEQRDIDWYHMEVETVKAVRAMIGIPEYPRYDALAANADAGNGGA